MAISQSTVTIEGRIEAQRARLFQAQGIAEALRRAMDQDDKASNAAAALVELLDDIAARLDPVNLHPIDRAA